MAPPGCGMVRGLSPIGDVWRGARWLAWEKTRAPSIEIEEMEDGCVGA